MTLPVLAHVFEEEGALEKLEAFVSLHGAAFYGVAPNAGTVTLERVPLTGVAPKVETPEGTITVFDPGYVPAWRVAGRSPA